MSVTYLCRHCAAKIGQINDPEITELKLGFHFLTPEERSDIITYSQDGDVTVKLVCDYCMEALAAHPELNLVGSPLQ